ncbi:hypothetical protein D3C76_1550390 [compost metagenome]
MGAQGIAGNAQQRRGAVEQQAAALIAVQQCQQQQPGADAVQAQHAGLDHGVLQQADGLRRQGGGAGAAGFEQVQGLVGFRRHRVTL